MDKSIVGDLINFRGLVYAPVNENGVVFLFGKVADDLNMYIEEIKPGFPDCIGRRFIGKGWERIAIEFEFKSSNFVQHGHDVHKCDLIICWEHDWKDCPIEVIELKSEIQDMENYPIKRPGSTEKQEKDIESDINTIINKVSALPKVREWYDRIFENVSLVNDAIWAKVGKKYIGWYAPERAFASVCILKTSIRIECFSGDASIEGTKVVNTKYSPRWVNFSVKSDSDAEKASKILVESQNRLRVSIKRGEQTGYFSGGEQVTSIEKHVDEDE